jgi:hypothetical protein
MKRGVSLDMLNLHLQLLTAPAVEPETAPSGMVGRGHYKAISKFVDDDNVTHLQFEWAFDVKKDW